MPEWGGFSPPRMNHIEVPHNRKLNLLNDHDGDWTDLEQSKWRLHCSKSFAGLSVRAG